MEISIAVTMFRHVYIRRKQLVQKLNAMIMEASQNSLTSPNGAGGGNGPAQGAAVNPAHFQSPSLASLAESTPASSVSGAQTRRHSFDSDQVPSPGLAHQHHHHVPQHHHQQPPQQLKLVPKKFYLRGQTFIRQMLQRLAWLTLMGFFVLAFAYARRILLDRFRPENPDPLGLNTVDVVTGLFNIAITVQARLGLQVMVDMEKALELAIMPRRRERRSPPFDH
ncbi:hypothetical protein HK102_010435 [Quaeritorhiza haematococci]|nr:hypothetical protein HK102_010435 [Quaeritorhiza haematococci]